MATEELSVDQVTRALDPKWHRYVALGLGLLFGIGAVWKAVAWPSTVRGMEVYTVLGFLPPVVTAGGSLLAELAVAFTLLHERLWHRIGLPLSIAFLVLTSGILAWQVTAGGGANCGCLPFLPRRISWLATGQNVFAAIFLVGVWGLAREEERGKEREDERKGSPGTGSQPTPA